MVSDKSNDPLVVTILVLPETSLMTIAATIDPMRAANRLGARLLYTWRIVSIDGNPITTTSGTVIKADASIDDHGIQDVTFILGSFHVEKHTDSKVLRYIKNCWRNSRLIGGFDCGAEALATAGLLNGRKATTHWEHLEQFAARFPEIDVRPDRFVLDGFSVTCGGAATVLDFMLDLIRLRQGNLASMNVASLFTYERDKRSSDLQHIVALGEIDRREPRVSHAIRVMEAHIDLPLAISEIARRTKISKRTAEALFRQSLGISPGAFYMSLRLQAARRLIIDTKLSLADTAERTGFSSISSLSRAYRRHYGHPPSRERHSRIPTPG